MNVHVHIHTYTSICTCQLFISYTYVHIHGMVMYIYMHICVQNHFVSSNVPFLLQFDDATGELNITGEATAEVYSAILQHITYFNR